MILLHQAKIFILEIPFSHPFRVSFGEIKKRKTIVLQLLTKDGVEGYGEAPVLEWPIYNSEDIETVVHVLKDIILPYFFKKRIQKIEEIFDFLNLLRGHNFAKTCFEMALWEIYSKITKKPLVKIFGGKRKKLFSSITLGIEKKPLETLKMAEKFYKFGFRYFKLKIKPGFDIKYIQALKKEFPDVPLMVDANASYEYPKHKNLLRKISEMDINLIEQPLEYFDLYFHSKLQKEIKIPIGLDESIESFKEARSAIEMGACKAINVKIPRVGGLIEAKRICNFAKKKKIPLWCGGMLESGVGLRFNVLLATNSAFKYPIDFLDGILFYKNKLDFFKEEVVFKESYLYLPQNAWYSLDLKKLHNYSVSVIEIKK